MMRGIGVSIGVAALLAVGMLNAPDGGPARLTFRPPAVGHRCDRGLPLALRFMTPVDAAVACLLVGDGDEPLTDSDTYVGCVKKTCAGTCVLQRRLKKDPDNPGKPGPWGDDPNRPDPNNHRIKRNDDYEYQCICKPPPPPSPKRASIDKDPAFKPFAPSNEGSDSQSVTSEVAYAPKTAGIGEITFYVRDSQTPPTDGPQSGPTNVVVLVVTADGKNHPYATTTDKQHRVTTSIPALIDGSAPTLIEIGTTLEKDGHLDPRAANTAIGDGPVPNTDAVPNPPASGPAIVSGSTAYERTPGRNLVDLGVRGIDPENTRLEIDGRSEGILTAAASTTSIEGELDPNTSEGRHRLRLVSNGQPSNELPFDAVTLVAHPLPPTATGSVETLTIEVHGIGNDPASMLISVSGAATLAGGGTTTSVPVHDGIVEVQLRGTHAGAADVRFKLAVKIEQSPA